MILTEAHDLARTAAARLPALYATFGLLTQGPGPATIDIVAGTVGTPGDVLATIDMAAGVGSVNEGNYRINLTAPIEGQTLVGGEAGFARVYGGDGVLLGSATISDSEGGGEIKLASLTLTVGAFVRITSAHFQG